MQPISSLPPAELPEALRAAIETARSEPDRDDLWEAVDDAARDADQPDEVSELYREILNQELEPELAERLGQRAVAFHDEWYEDPSFVIQILKRLVTLGVGSWAFERLSLLLTMAERWDDLLGEYDRALSSTRERERRLKLLDEAARIAKDFAGQAQRASDYLKELVLTTPQNFQLADSLERRLEQQNRHKDLIDLWQARLPVLIPAEALKTRVHIADRHLNQLADAPAALGVAEQILELGGGEVEACQLLEQIAARESAEVTARRRALGILRERYAGARRSEDVIRILELSLTVAASEDEQRELHEALTRWLSESERFEEALQHCAALFQLEPDSAEVHAQLKSLAERTGQQERYAVALVAAADATRAPERRVELLVEAGKVSELKVDDAQGAIDLYLRVLDDAGADDQARLFVARRLRQLLQEAGDNERLLEVVERLAGLEPNTRGQRSVLGEAAALADQLGDIDRSLGLWQRALEVSEGDLGALDARIVILERAERWEALIADYRKRASQSTNASGRRDDLVRVARIYETKLERLEHAIEVWRDIEQQFESNAETVDALVELCTAAARYNDVIALLKSAVETEADTERRTAQLSRLGDVYREHEKDMRRAVEYYRQALEVSPLYEPARAGLRTLLGDKGAAPAAVETLAMALTAADEWPGVLELVELRVSTSEAPENVQRVLLEAAAILELRAQDPSGALRYLCRAFALDPAPELEMEMRRLAKTSGEWSLTVMGYQNAMQRSTDARRVRELGFARGQLLEERLDDRQGALAAYHQIIESDPTHVDAACAAVRVAIRLGAWHELGWVFVAHAHATGRVERALVLAVEAAAEEHNAWQHSTQAIFERIDSTRALEPKVGHDLRRELGIWYRDRRSDAKTAEQLLALAVGLYKDPDTLSMLAAMQRKNPGRALVATLLALADATNEDLSVLHEAARVARLTVQDVALSRPILERALGAAALELRRQSSDGFDGAPLRPSLAPMSGERRVSEPPIALDRATVADIAWWCTDELVKLDQAQANPSEALRRLLDGAALPFDRERSIELSYRAAVVAAESLKDLELAVDTSRKILERAPDHAPTIALLGTIFEETARYQELYALRQAELAQKPALERRLLLRLDQARILELLNESADRRVEALRQNVEEAPGHAASIDALAAILSGLGEHEELFKLLSGQAKKVARKNDPELAASLWARAGALAESAQGDVERAVGAYEQSVQLAPQSDVLDSLARLSTAQERHPDAVKWLEQRLSLTQKSARAERQSTLVRLATALRASKEESRARRYLSDGLEDDPAGGELRSLLAELYRESEDWQLLAPLLSAGVQYAKDSETKVGYLRDAARVRRHRLGQLDEAIPLLEQAVALAPGDRSLRLSLADALRHAERYDEARTLLQGLLTEFGRRRTPERAQVHYHLAQIARATGDLDTALKELDLASSVDRNNVNMLKLLADVAREKGQLEEAERAYRTLLLLIGRTRRGDSEAPPPIGESSILFELHRIATDLGQTERAKDLLDSALEAGSQDEAEAKRLEQALSDAGHHDLMLRSLEQRLLRTDDPRAAAEILRTRAEVLLGLGDRDAALDNRIQALVKNPGSASAIRETWELASELGKTQVVSNEVARLAESAREGSPEIACELWLSLGSVAEQQGDLQQAAALYAQAQQTRQKPVECLRAVEQVCQKTGDQRLLAQGLEVFVDAADPDEAPELYTDALYRLGATELEQGKDDEGAEHLEQALERDLARHQHADVLAKGGYQRVIDVLEQSVATGKPSAAVVHLLERVARLGDDQRLLLLALTRAAELGTAEPEGLREAVQLAQKAGDEPATSRLLERAVALARDRNKSSDEIWAAAALAEVHERNQAHDKAIALLQDTIEHVPSSQSFELKLRLATLAHEHLSDLELAEGVYEELLESKPTESRVFKPLFDVYRKRGEPQKLEARISAIESAVADPSQRHSLRIERIRILIDSNRKPEAEQALIRVLEEDPASDEASELLESLFESDGRRDELTTLIELRLESARERGDGPGVTQRALQLGRMLAQSDRKAAIGVYRGALPEASDKHALLLALLGLLEGDGDAQGRAEVLDRLLELESGQTAVLRTLELVELWKGEDDAAGVELALLKGLTRAPDSERLRSELSGWYRERKEWDKLARALVADAEAQADASAAKERFRQAARVYESELGDAERAAQTLEQATERSPTDPELLAQVAQYWQAANNPGRALEHVTSAIEAHPGSDATLAELLHLRGTLRLRLNPDSIDNLQATVLDFDSAAQHSPERALADLALVLRRMLELLARREGAESEQGAATLHLCRVLVELGQLDEAGALLDDWSTHHPSDAAALEQLGNLASVRQDWGKAIGAFRSLVSLSSGAAQVQAVLRLAESCERAGDPMAAKDALELVHARAPEEEAIRRRLRQMYESARAYRDWAKMLVADADAGNNPGERFDLYNMAGDLFMKDEGGAEDAARAYEKALAVDSNSAGPLIKLVDVQVQLGDVEAAATRLDEAIRSYGKRRSPDLSQLQHAMARVARAAGDDEAAFAWLEAAMYSDRQNGPVAAELAALAMERGEFDVAIKALQLVTLLKTPGPMTRAEAYLRQAAIAKHRGDTKKAALLAKRAVTTDPEYQDAKAFLDELGPAI
jgi:tetratricopeptide (TPR) repeat protein